MASYRVAFWIEPQDYKAFQAVILDNGELPKTFDEWFESAIKQVAEYETAGKRVEKNIVKPDQFVAWCKEAGMNANRTSLEAFAVAQDAMKRNHIDI